MAWAPNDLLSDVDLEAYEAGILTQFARQNWLDKRAKAIEDWLAPILRTREFDIERLRTRYEPDLVSGYTAAAYSDKRGEAIDTTADDLNLATVFATVGTDALYIGSTRQFRGLSVRMMDAVSAVAATLTVSAWTDGWEALSIYDGTQKTPTKSFSGGGAITWRVPPGWVKRPVDSSDPLYVVKLTMSATPTSAKCGQIGVIRRSALCAPVAFRTLALIMREAPTGADGPWSEKAAWYETEADAALQRALEVCGGEFEADDSVTDQIDATEAEQTVAEVSRGAFRLERG
jgi:hypothetical protein